MALERFQSDKLKLQLMKCRLPALLILLLFAGVVVDHAFKRTVVRPAEVVQSPERPPRISVCQLKSDICCRFMQRIQSASRGCWLALMRRRAAAAVD